MSDFSSLDSKVSLFGDAWKNEPMQAPTVRQILSDVKSGKYRKDIVPLRALVAAGDTVTYDKQKKRLPCFTLSAHLHHRKKDVPLDEKLITHSNLLQIDIDKPQHLLDLKAQIEADEHVLFCFLSPSGIGLKACVRIDGTRHPDSFKSAERYFKDTHGVTIDTACKDVVRPFFVSWDPDLFMRENVPVLPITSKPAKPKQHKADPSTSPTAGEDAIKRAVRMVEKAAEGEKRKELRAAARLLGGFVASGVVDIEQARQALREAIQKRKTVGDMNAAFKAIDEALEYGQRDPLEPEESSNGFFKCTDLGNAERFASRHRKAVRYCYPWKKWFRWTGTHWQIDDRGTVNALAKTVVRSIYGEAERCTDDDIRKAIAQWAVKSETRSAIDSMISLARSERDIPVEPQELDTSDWLLNTMSGTIDLKTGATNPHNPPDLITKLSPVYADPSAECPTWDAFLDKIMAGNKDLSSFLQRAIGCSLTGDTSEQCIFLCYGTGANGKSTFLNTIKALLNDYAKQAEFSTFIKKENETVRNDIADLRGARFVVAIEAEKGQRMAESMVKQMTGEDTLKARFLFREYFEFVPTFKIWLAANHKPIIRGTDHAIWRRIRLIFPFAGFETFAFQAKSFSQIGFVVSSLMGGKPWARATARGHIQSTTSSTTWCG